MSDAATRIDALAKMVDQALSAAFRGVLADHSTTVDEFVMLGLLVKADGPLPWDALEARMPGAPSAASLTHTWTGLANGGWAHEDDGICLVTDEGRTAYEDLHAEIDALHARAVAGIGDTDYATAIRVLTRMLDNLDD